MSKIKEKHEAKLMTNIRLSPTSLIMSSDWEVELVETADAIRQQNIVLALLIEAKSILDLICNLGY